MSTPTAEYGMWLMVVVNSLIFIVFAASFTKPKTKLDWRSLSAFSAFIIAMFTEMYGFPFTIYILSGWLQTRFPQVDIFSHDNGHIWQILFGFHGNPHMNPIHLAGNILIFIGMLIVISAWKKLHAAQKQKTLAVEGPYAIVRHPQYCGFILIITGFFMMWPTLLTLVMFPVMIVVYIKLSKKEEELVRKEFSAAYEIYSQKVPAYFPRFGGQRK